MACYLTDLPARYSGQVFLFSQVCNPDGLADALWGGGDYWLRHIRCHLLGGIAYCVIKKD